MDLHKAKIFLDKINREYARMSKDPENIMRIDVDIMLAYVRDLYEALLAEPATPVAPTQREAPARATPPPMRSAPPEPVPAPEAAPPPPPPAASVAPPAPTLSEAVKNADPLPQIKPQPTATPPTPPPSFPAPPPEAEALFEYKQAVELSEKLSELPIADLRKAIGLNDRLLLTRELFGEDSEAFDKTISALNSFASMEQAKAFLLEHCVMRYRWTDKKRIETAKKFIKLVRRRYA
ncbi:MAG: hypothetical protein RMJ33_11985 [Saprospiraceae bacterium]|nr:hypothetical protein [Saprospiraceae bacterium]MDW8230548.1 hypothetical protein [Saprospiraceae bacterium]